MIEMPDISWSNGCFDLFRIAFNALPVCEPAKRVAGRPRRWPIRYTRPSRPLSLNLSKQMYEGPPCLLFQICSTIIDTYPDHFALLPRSTNRLQHCLGEFDR